MKGYHCVILTVQESIFPFEPHHCPSFRPRIYLVQVAEILIVQISEERKIPPLLNNLPPYVTFYYILLLKYP